MGSASVPSSTSTYQQQSTGLWGSPEAIALAKPILKPALQNIKNQQTMLAGVQSGDPTQTAKFFGLPTNASTDDIVHAMSSVRQGPTVNPAPVINTTTGPTKTAAQGGIMTIGEDESSDPRRRYAKGSSATTTPKATTAAQDKYVANYNNLKHPLPAQTAKANAIKQQQQAYTDYSTKQNAIQAGAKAAGIAPSNAYLGQAGYAGLTQTGTDKYGNPTYDVSNPYYNQAAGVLQGMETQPGQFGQATDLYNKAAGRSWADPGTAQAYMNPYMQTALQSQEDLANRQFAQQQNQLRSRAAQAGAFGGSGSALAEQAAQQNQNLNMQNLVAQGMNQAYQQGMGQFSNEQGQMLGAAGGLGSLGSNIGNYNLNLASGLGQAGSTLQNMLTNAANQTQTNASNITQGPTNQGTTGINMLAGTGGGNAGYGTTIQKTQ